MRSRFAVLTLVSLAILMSGFGSPAIGANIGVTFEPGDRFTASIDPADETDFFVFDAVEGEILTVKLKAAKGSALVPALAIFDPEGSAVDPGAALVVKRNKVTLKKLRLVKTGRYALGVRSDGATTGAYDLATKATLPKLVKLKKVPLAGATVRDIPFAGTSDSTVKVSLKSKGGEGFTVTGVYDPTGAEVPGALGTFVTRKQGVKGAFRLGQGTGLYGIRVTVGASAIDFTAKVTTKFPKPPKRRVALGMTEPRVSLVSPPTDYPGETVIIDGENFTAGTRVYFGDVFATATFVSTTRLSATVPAGTGTVRVGALDADGQGDALPGAFTYSTAGPSVEVAFPPAYSKTDGATLAVVGSANSPVGVAAVRVNGTAATSSDGFLTWRARVPLTRGTNTLTVATEDTLGNLTTSAARVTVVRTSPIPSSPFAFAMDSTNGRVLLVDYGRNALYALDLSSGETTLLSGDTIGSGPAMDLPWAVAHDPDDNRVFISDVTQQSIYAIDLATGNRTVIASNKTGTGTDLEVPEDLVYDPAASRVIVSDTVLDAIVAVDVATGNRTVLSDEGEGIGAGPALVDPKGLCLDAANSRVLVADGRSLTAVSLLTGDRTVISNSDLGVGTGSSIRQIQKVDLDAAGDLVYAVDRWTQNVVGIELATGNRSTIGDMPEVHRDIAYDPAGRRPLILLQHFSGVGAMDPGTGAITWIHDLFVGSGPGLGDIVAMGFDERDGRVLVASRSAVMAVDYSTGDRAVLSGSGKGSGPNLLYLSAGDIDTATRRFLVVEETGDKVISVDIDTGNRTLVSEGATATGPALTRPAGAKLDVAGNRIIVLCQQPFAVVSVDLATGNRVLVADDTTGTGPALEHADGMDLDLANGRALVVDRVEDALLGVDLATGNRTILSSTALGTGDPFNVPFDVSLEPSGTSALVLEHPSGFLVRVDLATGDRTTASREHSGVGTGPGFTMPEVVVGDGTGHGVLVGNTDSPAVLLAERQSGDRVYLTKE